MFKFKMDEKVRCTDIPSEGVVVGVSTTGLPILGVGYIVKVTDGSIPTEEYPYDTRTVFEIHLESMTNEMTPITGAH